MRKKEALRIIQDEINWCKKNPKTSGEPKSFERGFILGLKTAKSLIDTSIKGEPHGKE